MLDTKKINTAGLCIQCHREIFDVSRIYPLDSILKGLPQNLGVAKSDCRTVTVVLADQSRMDITACADCTENLDLRAAWLKVIAAWDLERQPAYREAVNIRPLTAPQKLRLDEWIECQMSSNSILGLLWIEAGSKGG